MEKWYRPKEVAEILSCQVDTARAWMAEMPNVINVGSEKRQQLMVPESDIENWLRNHRVTTRVEIRMPEYRMNRSGKIARMDRRTGKLKAV